MQVIACLEPVHKTEGAEQTASFKCIQDSSLLLLRSLAQILLRGECPIIQGTSEIATAKPAQAP